MGKNNWTEIAIELQALAQTGLHYTKDVFDKERFERIREISALMMSELVDEKIEKVRALFLADSGYQTPKMEVRAAVFKDKQILLVQELDGRWAMPGGWVDVTVSVKENALKEVYEEAGVNARFEKLVAVQERDRHHLKKSSVPVCTVLVNCSHLSGVYQKNIETLDSQYFSLEELPELWEGKTTKEQIALCFEAMETEHWQTILD